MGKQDFIIEVGTEELPPVALKGLAQAFHDSLVKLVTAGNLSYRSSEVFATPRRLAIMFYELDSQQADQTNQKLGPAVAAAFDDDGKPTKAAEGFARSCGVSVAELETINTDKGERLGLNVIINGLATTDLLPIMIAKAIQQIPIPKAMRWGNNSESFVRPVKWVLALHGQEVVPMQLFGVAAGRISRGHRFMAKQDISLQSASEYTQKLYEAKVVVSQSERMSMIRDQVTLLAKERGFVAVIDDALVEEVSALVEWPVALLGNFESAFLDVPKEALISTMSKNQKYFHLEDEAGNLVPHFITLANIISPDPDVIIDGNEKVIRPRLADAKFFYEKDGKRSLAFYAKRLKGVVFQNELGTVADKCQRIEQAALMVAQQLGANDAHVALAAQLCKADLVTDMVNEFPNLQGIMGKYYAQGEGLPDDVCLALEEVYLPRHAGDNLPQTAVGLCLALADRLDTLVGVFGIKQAPTGNKDPFALRRAALGVINICIHHRLELDLNTLIRNALSGYDNFNFDDDLSAELQRFFTSRLRALALESGFSAQEFNAVEFTGLSNIYDFWLRLTAVAEFAKQPEAEVLAESNKRLANILSKNLSNKTIPTIDAKLFIETPESDLYKALSDIKPNVLAACEERDYAKAFVGLSGLKGVIDAFFDSVMVMHEDLEIQNNRLALLYELRKLFVTVADISRLQK